jgi:hypothetical protein
VLGRIQEAQGRFFATAEWQRMDRMRQVEEIQAVIERIGYDNIARQIPIRFRPAGVTAERREVRALPQRRGHLRAGFGAGGKDRGGARSFHPAGQRAVPPLTGLHG